MGIVPNVSGYGTGGETSPDEPNPVSSAGQRGYLHRGEALGGTDPPLQHYHEGLKRLRGEGREESENSENGTTPEGSRRKCTVFIVEVLR